MKAQEDRGSEFLGGGRPGRQRLGVHLTEAPGNFVSGDVEHLVYFDSLNHQRNREAREARKEGRKEARSTLRRRAVGFDRARSCGAVYAITTDSLWACPCNIDSLEIFQVKIGSKGDTTCVRSEGKREPARRRRGPLGPDRASFLAFAFFSSPAFLALASSRKWLNTINTVPTSISLRCWPHSSSYGTHADRFVKIFRGSDLALSSH